MKKVSIFSLIAFFAILVSSCGSSNNVVSNHGISKRKYNKGYFFQRHSNVKTADARVKNTELNEGTTIAKSEKTERVTAKFAATNDSEGEVAAKPEKTKKVKLKKEEVHSGLYAPSESWTEADANIAPAEYRHPSERDSEQDALNDGINWSVSENNTSATGESIESMPYENRNRPAQKEKNNASGASADLMFVLAVIFAILIPPLGVAIYTYIDWMKVLIAFLLTLLFILPGIIYALLVVFDKV